MVALAHAKTLDLLVKMPLHNIKHRNLTLSSS
jgi:hypothetical protein